MIQEEAPKAFKFVDFTIPRFSVDIDNTIEYKIKMSFKPFGKYFETTGIYELHLFFEATDEGTQEVLISANPTFIFEFDKSYSFDEVPEYFFTNSIPIGFPYLRAFISSITLQANLDVIMLDLVKFSNIAKALKENTEVIKKD
ncbi:hypothetical protein [Flavobacterium sangjuense]|uniref:Protein-export protein SecB n=1 Tax=Flavobacterium sangjuense TaxID=2518177 RepID=A0A4V1CC50_9FLAO|nr:hypothetical protein [Flavobacterium sangjuense]QBZ98254.1 hypothetical protein GS03_01759 [Flavobacterium sangjuense]